MIWRHGLTGQATRSSVQRKKAGRIFSLLKNLNNLKGEFKMSDKKKRIAIIASKGTLDMAYPPLILATTAAAMDIECSIFFTFYGLDIINKKKNKNLQGR